MVKATDIWTPSSNVENLADEFRQETEMMLKKVAHDNNCNVEELKFNVNSNGMVNIRRMTGEEMVEMSAQEAEDNRIREIKKSRKA